MSGLQTHPAPYAGAPVVVMVSGLGGTGGYWLPQLAVLKARYQVCLLYTSDADDDLTTV